MTCITSNFAPKRVFPSTNSYPPQETHAQFRGIKQVPAKPPEKPAKASEKIVNQPQKPEWLKRVAIGAAVLGSGLTGYGIINNIGSTTNQTPQVQTEKASARSFVERPLVSSQTIQDKRTLNAEFTGSRSLSLATCSLDGYDVSGTFYLTWEKDLLTANPQDRETQLKLILDKLPPEKILPKWKEAGVYLVAAQKPEGVITYAKEIVEAYQNHLIDTVIQPELLSRFNTLFGEKSTEHIENNLQNLLFRFENNSGDTTLKAFMNNQGVTPTSIGFHHIHVGTKAFQIQKVVTTEIKVEPTISNSVTPENSSSKKWGEPTLAEPPQPPPDLPDPLPYSVQNIPK